MVYPANLQNISFKYLYSEIHKYDIFFGFEYAYFQTSKFYQILSFLCIHNTNKFALLFSMHIGYYLRF